MTTSELLHLIIAGLSSLAGFGMLVIAWALLKPRRQEAEAEAASDTSTVQLNAIKMMEVNQADLRLSLAETKTELSELKKERFDEEIAHRKEMAERDRERDAMQARIDRLSEVLGKERKARQSLERKYAELKQQYDGLVQENKDLRAQLNARGAAEQKKAA